MAGITLFAYYFVHLKGVDGFMKALRRALILERNQLLSSSVGDTVGIIINNSAVFEYLSNAPLNFN